MTSAVQQVFSTPELLEMILLHLGPHGFSDKAILRRMKRLRKAQRISREFQQTVDSSIHLQRARFIAHSTTPQLDRRGEPIFNPLLEKFSLKNGWVEYSFRYSSAHELLTLDIRRNWQYQFEEDYEALEEFEDDSWRSLKICASKVDVEVYLRRGHDGAVYDTRNQTHYLRDEPGDFGVLFDLIKEA